MDFFGAQDNILWNKNASEGHLFGTAFVKFKISNNFKQNIDKTHLKQPKIHKIHTCLYILKITGKKSANQKNRKFYQMFEIFKKKIIP
jgi:hypothetical protein